MWVVKLRWQGPAILSLCSLCLAQCLAHSRWPVLGCVTDWGNEWSIAGGSTPCRSFKNSFFLLQIISKITFTLQKRQTSKRTKASRLHGEIRCMLASWDSCFSYWINPSSSLMTSLVFALHHLTCLLLCSQDTHGQHWLGSEAAAKHVQIILWPSALHIL